MSDKKRDGPPSNDAEPPKYEVGYGKPPSAHQFKPGKSGNPKGRPKGAKSEASILQTLLNRKIEVREGRRTRKISVREAILLRFAEDALKGNIKTATFLLNRDAAAQTGEADPDGEMSKDDREVLEAFAQQYGKQLHDEEENP